MFSILGFLGDRNDIKNKRLKRTWGRERWESAEFGKHVSTMELRHCYVYTKLHGDSNAECQGGQTCNRKGRNEEEVMFTENP